MADTNTQTLPSSLGKDKTYPLSTEDGRDLAELRQIGVTIRNDVIKKHVSEDLIMAKLSEQDQRYVVEMLENITNTLKHLTKLRDSSKRWIWYENEHIWKLEKLTDVQKAKIDREINWVKETMLTKVNATLLVNRNRDDNHLLKWLMGVGETQEDNLKSDAERLTAAIKEKLSNE